MKTKVVCDANIWYYFSDGTIDPKTLSEYCLIATFYTFEELHTTSKTVSDFSKVQKAAKAIVDHSCEQRIENAILYLAKLIYPSFQDKRKHYDLCLQNWTELKRMAVLPENFQPGEAVTKLYEVNVEKKTKDGEAVSNIENSLSEQVKKQAKKHWKKDKTEYSRSSLQGIPMLAVRASVGRPNMPCLPWRVLGEKTGSL